MATDQIEQVVAFKPGRDGGLVAYRRSRYGDHTWGWMEIGGIELFSGGWKFTSGKYQVTLEPEELRAIADKIDEMRHSAP